MRWEDERYVRLYTRDTTTWKKLPWQSRCVLALLLRKLDRAGVVELDGDGAEDIAVITELPLEVVEAGMPKLLEKGVFVMTKSRIVMPNFMAAQEASQSDRARKRKEREQARARALSDTTVTDRDVPSQDVTQESQDVTKSHAESQGVTIGHTTSQSVTPSLAVPSLAVPSRAEGVQGEHAENVVGPGTDPAITLASGDASAPHKKTKRRKPKAPAPEVPIPEPGTVARSVYDAIVNDPILGPITAGPADFAVRITHPDAYPGVNVLAEVLRAAEHYARGKRVYTDGRRTLANWLRGEAEKEASRPKPTPNQLALGAKKTKGPLDPAPASKFTRPGESYDPFSLYNADGSPKGATQ